MKCASCDNNNSKYCTSLDENNFKLASFLIQESTQLGTFCRASVNLSYVKDIKCKHCETYHVVRHMKEFAYIFEGQTLRELE